MPAFRNRYLIARLILVCPTVSAASLPGDAIDRIRQVVDSEYAGGLTSEEQTLARQLASEIAGTLPGESHMCDPFDPTRGELIGRTPPSHSTDSSESLPEPLRAAIALIGDGTPVQSAIAPYAIGFVGTKAVSAAAPLGAISKRTPWVGEALCRIDCQAWEVGGFAAGMGSGNGVRVDRSRFFGQIN